MKRTDYISWDEYFMGIAMLAARRSKDPNTQVGACIVPACPGFYHRPQTLEDVIDMMVGKICDQLGIEHNLFERWQG